MSGRRILPGARLLGAQRSAGVVGAGAQGRRAEVVAAGDETPHAAPPVGATARTVPQVAATAAGAAQGAVAAAKERGSKAGGAATAVAPPPPRSPPDEEGRGVPLPPVRVAVEEAAPQAAARVAVLGVAPDEAVRLLEGEAEVVAAGEGAASVVADAAPAVAVAPRRKVCRQVVTVGAGPLTGAGPDVARRRANGRDGVAAAAAAR